MSHHYWHRGYGPPGWSVADADQFRAFSDNRLVATVHSLEQPHSFPPTITLVSPTDASAGTRIQITGTRFLEGDLEVLFNGVSGIDIEVVDGSTILVTVPELPAGGPVTITVRTDEGSVTLTDGLQ